MTHSKIVIAAALALLVIGSSAQAQHRGGGRARGGAAVAGRAVPRGEVRGAPRTYAVPRTYAAPRVYAAPRGVRVAPIRFYQPYYTFRPRLSLGFGLWLGYPVRYTSYYGYYNPFYSSYYPYPYAYPYPYPYAYPYPSAYPAYPPTTYPPSAYPSPYPPPSAQPAYPQSTYPPQGSISPSQPNMGGMSFEIQPSDAQVYVDGRYVGTVGQFTAASQPLGLTAGRHHIQITAPGYRAMDFDADIVAGEVLPYQGTLER